MKMIAAMQTKLEAVEGLPEAIATLQEDVKSLKVKIYTLYESPMFCFDNF